MERRGQIDSRVTQLLYITALAYKHAPVFACVKDVLDAYTKAQKGIRQSCRISISSLWFEILKRHAEMLDGTVSSPDQDGGNVLAGDPLPSNIHGSEKNGSLHSIFVAATRARSSFDT